MQRAERRAEAIVYWRKAGEQAARRAGNREAEGHFRRALSLLEAQPETNERRRAELAILSQLAPALMAVHGMAAAEVGKVVERATEVGQSLESSQELAPSIANLWLYHFASGRLDAAAGISDKLFRIAREHDDPEILLQAYHTAWPVDWLRGSLTVALEHIDLGLALYDEERHAHHRFVYFGHDPCVCGLGIAQHINWALGYPTRAGHAGDKAVTLARRLKHEPTLVHALWFVAEGHTLSRDVAAVMANTSELLKLAEEYKLPQQRATGMVVRGWAIAVSGNVAEGLALADEGIAWLERSANRGFLARLYAPLAETYFLAGRHAEGLQRMERGPQILAETGNSFYLPRLLQIQAKLLEATGRHGEAEASLRQSLDMARAQGAKSFELRAVMGLLRLSLSQGRRDEARTRLQSICDSFVDGFDTPDFKEAKELLEAHS
jgi:predicted ATPase